MRSAECTTFLENADVSTYEARDRGVTLSLKIIEAVSPIIPFKIRNRSLDGGYLRTALTLLGASEILFTQFDVDIRRSGNPAGAVGMAQSMHNEIERATLYGNQELEEYSRGSFIIFVIDTALTSFLIKHSAKKLQRSEFYSIWWFNLISYYH